MFQLILQIVFFTEFYVILYSTSGCALMRLWRGMVGNRLRERRREREREGGREGGRERERGGQTK